MDAMASPLHTAHRDNRRGENPLCFNTVFAPLATRSPIHTAPFFSPRQGMSFKLHPTQGLGKLEEQRMGGVNSLPTGTKRPPMLMTSGSFRNSGKSRLIPPPLPLLASARQKVPHSWPILGVLFTWPSRTDMYPCLAIMQSHTLIVCRTHLQIWSRGSRWSSLRPLRPHQRR